MMKHTYYTAVGHFRRKVDAQAQLPGDYHQSERVRR